MTAFDARPGRFDAQGPGFGPETEEDASPVT